MEICQSLELYKICATADAEMYNVHVCAYVWMMIAEVMMPLMMMMMMQTRAGQLTK